MARIEDRVDTKLSLNAGLGTEVQELLNHSRSQDQGLLELRGELGLLQSHISKLEKAQVVAGNEAAAAALTSVQRKQVRSIAGWVYVGRRSQRGSSSSAHISAEEAGEEHRGLCLYREEESKGQ